tara:strand:+ start:216803 stop:217678 length:876 start_codon:yes stop_codon:yes gene_type:complete
MLRVFITGASGNTGKVLLGELSQCGLVPVAGLRGERPTGLLPADCESRAFTYGNGEQAAAALAGIQGLFLLVPFHEEMIAWSEQIVAEAKRQGVTFIVRLSGLDASPDCASAMGALHGKIDELVMASGIDYCILRCNSFMQNFTGHYLGMIRRHRLIALPEGAARSCFVDTADVAAVAARIFAEPRLHAGKTYDVGGPEPLCNAAVADIISDVIGTGVTYRPATDEETERSYRKLGLSPWRIATLMSLSRYIRQGHAAQTTEVVEHVLGRPPVDFRHFAERHRGCWLDLAQ